MKVVLRAKPVTVETVAKVESSKVVPEPRHSKMAYLLLNKSHAFWRSIALKLPVKFRIWFKNTKFWLPFEFLKWVIIDLQRPQFFHPFGMYFMTGLPGAGKTIFTSSMLLDFKKKYKDSIYIATNYGLKGQDLAISGYKDLLKLYDKPIIIGYDEIQNDFDAREWQNIDYAFSERITQSRKVNGMMILATAQKFGFVDRRLRQLTKYVFECQTFLNRLTVARIFEPEMKEKIESGQFTSVNSLRSRGMRFVVQSDSIRDSFDSYQLLESITSKLDTKLHAPAEILDAMKSYFGSTATT